MASEYEVSVFEVEDIRLGGLYSFFLLTIYSLVK